MKECLPRIISTFTENLLKPIRVLWSVLNFLWLVEMKCFLCRYYCQQFLDAVPSIVQPVIKYLLLSQLCKIEQCFDNWQTSYYCFHVRVFRSACLFFNPCIFSSCKVFAVLNFCSFCLGFDKCDQSNITACNTTQNKKK